MKIESAEHILLNGRPCLRLKIDGKEALISDFKPPLVMAGFVPLGSSQPDVQWGNILPVIEIPPIPGFSEDILYGEGVTNHPKIVELAQSFHADVSGTNARGFQEGQIEI